MPSARGMVLELGALGTKVEAKGGDLEDPDFGDHEDDFTSLRRNPSVSGSPKGRKDALF
jgi:hypothetical protein